MSDWLTVSRAGTSGGPGEYVALFAIGIGGSVSAGADLANPRFVPAGGTVCSSIGRAKVNLAAPVTFDLLFSTDCANWTSLFGTSLLVIPDNSILPVTKTTFAVQTLPNNCWLRIDLVSGTAKDASIALLWRK